MAGAGVECAGGQKERDYWKLDALTSYRDNPSETMHTWMGTLSACNETGEVRRVSAEFTTAYMAGIPKLSSSIEEAVVTRVPWVLATLYGTHGKDVQFVVMLRNPLPVMRTEWKVHHSDEDFHQWAVAEMREMRQSAWSGMYGVQLQTWTLLFSDSQFYMIPYKLFSGAESEKICKALSARLQFPMVCAPIAETINDPWMDTETRDLWNTTSYQDTLGKDKVLLTVVMQRGSQNGMGLANYSGIPGNHTAIKVWLEKHW